MFLARLGCEIRAVPDVGYDLALAVAVYNRAPELTVMVLTKIVQEPDSVSPEEVVRDSVAVADKSYGRYLAVLLTEVLAADVAALHIFPIAFVLTALAVCTALITLI